MIRFFVLGVGHQLEWCNSYIRPTPGGETYGVGVNFSKFIPSSESCQCQSKLIRFYNFFKYESVHLLTKSPTNFPKNLFRKNICNSIGQNYIIKVATSAHKPIYKSLDTAYFISYLNLPFRIIQYKYILYKFYQMSI